jgi:hypothetical protein
MDLDEQTAHHHFSAQFFNRTWEFIDLPTRTSQDEETMLELAMASLAHWKARSDLTPRNLSIGCWQVSRVFALAGEAGLARRYARRCLEHSQKEEHFYQGYAYEALARAEAAGGNLAEAKKFLGQAYNLAARIADPEERQQLEDDLDSLSSLIH